MRRSFPIWSIRNSSKCERETIISSVRFLVELGALLWRPVIRKWSQARGESAALSRPWTLSPLQSHPPSNARHIVRYTSLRTRHSYDHSAAICIVLTQSGLDSVGPQSRTRVGAVLEFEFDCEPSLRVEVLQLHCMMQATYGHLENNSGEQMLIPTCAAPFFAETSGFSWVSLQFASKKVKCSIMLYFNC